MKPTSSRDQRNGPPTTPPTPTEPPSLGPRWLPAASSVAGILLLAIVLYLTGILRPGAKAPELLGSTLNPPAAAPDFQLNDQFNQPISMSAQRGKVVVLTFLYTNCPDVCPLITAKLHQAVGAMGADAANTSIIAVTVDPTRDTLAQVRQYSTEKDMLQKWHYLIGAPGQVSPVWSAYGVASVAAAEAPGASTPMAGGAASIAADSSITHSAPIFVIDKTGQERELYESDFNPSDLVKDVHTLLQQ